eukprot:5105432-Pyramimonas_sp.AAC.1
MPSGPGEELPALSIALWMWHFRSLGKCRLKSPRSPQRRWAASSATHLRAKLPWQRVAYPPTGRGQAKPWRMRQPGAQTGRGAIPEPRTAGGGRAGQQ